MRDGAADRPDGVAIDRGAGKGAVEVDNMQPGKPRDREVARLRRRVVVEQRRARHLAAHEADAGTVLEIDGREEDH